VDEADRAANTASPPDHVDRATLFPTEAAAHVRPCATVAALSLCHNIASLRRQDAIRLPLLTKYRSPAWLLCSPMHCANRCHQATAPCSRCAVMICFVHSSFPSIDRHEALWKHHAAGALLPPRSSPRWQPAFNPVSTSRNCMTVQRCRATHKPITSTCNPHPHRRPLHRAATTVQGGPFSGETSTLMCQALE
jgi:hypothetical protein